MSDEIIIPQQEDPFININKIFKAYVDVINTGSTTEIVDRAFLELCVTYRYFEIFCLLQFKLNVITKQEFYDIIEQYLATFFDGAKEETIVAIDSIIDILNNYCSKSQLKKFYNMMKSQKLKSKLKKD